MFDLLNNEVSKKLNQQGYANVQNNGYITTDRESYGILMKPVYRMDAAKGIKDQFRTLVNDYSPEINSAVDYVKMYLVMGLVYNGKDVDTDNNIIKEGAVPFNNIVRYNTSDFECYLDNEKLDIEKSKYVKHTDYCYKSGYINYNNFLRWMKLYGFEIKGPENFEEFKEQILTRNPFEISLGLNLDKEKKLVRKL